MESLVFELWRFEQGGVTNFFFLNDKCIVKKLRQMVAKIFVEHFYKVTCVCVCVCVCVSVCVCVCVCVCMG